MGQRVDGLLDLEMEEIWNQELVQALIGKWERFKTWWHEYLKTEIPNLFMVGFIVMLVIIQLIYLWNGRPDQALEFASKGGMPIPYGVFWTWLNPFWWTILEYKLYLTGIVMFINILQWQMVRKGKLPFSVALWSSGLNVIWFTLGGYQQITTTAFVTFSFWNPLLLIGWVFQKLPLGWSWGITDSPNWQCNFGDEKIFFTGTDGLDYQVCGHVLFGTPGHIAWHTLQLSWVAASIIFWIWKLRIFQRIFRK